MMAEPRMTMAVRARPTIPGFVAEALHQRNGELPGGDYVGHHTTGNVAARSRIAA